MSGRQAPCGDDEILAGREAPPLDGRRMTEAVLYAIRSRRSVRGFLPDSVPEPVIRELLLAAGRAPSGSNIQPWRVHVLTGLVLKRLTDLLSEAFLGGRPEQAEYNYYPTLWREPYLGRRRETGWGLYRLANVARGDHEASRRQRARNYRFFDAPVGMVFAIDNDLEPGSWLDYGMFLQGLMIAARAHGLDTCPQQSIGNYPDIVRKELDIPAGQTIVCGMALGRADATEPTNRLHTSRIPLETFVTFHG
jgi:nitroreductase